MIDRYDNNINNLMLANKNKQNKGYGGFYIKLRLIISFNL